MEFNIDISHIKNYDLLMLKFHVGQQVANDQTKIKEYLNKALFFEYMALNEPEFNEDFKEFNKALNKAFDEYEIFVSLKAKEIITEEVQEEIKKKADDNILEAREYIRHSVEIGPVLSSIMEEYQLRGIDLGVEDGQWIATFETEDVRYTGEGETIEKAVQSLEKKMA